MAQFAEIDFSTHILSLASSAMISMGRMQPGEVPDAPVDLQTAKYLIEVIAMLRDKTKGNLSEQEQSLHATLLHDLRVAFLEASKP